ncbi:glycosyl transferase [Ectothiorhodospira haloalkaliphila]|uniref:Glycosyl transferase n=1 Tax=Ectothiorhodospira haloalkaliphila TaxID=421628 RepID=W8L4S6_9GAMM|nr:glycosyltransferase family 2 protein [Ectothiorhodospira haloalkaliphila]AHK78910.1 glycosyl transferase [Ectothiorhodospira haloalkaliphila]
MKPSQQSHHTDTEPRYTGALTALHADILQGWAYDRHAPDVRLAVEIYLDGACVSVARADQYESHPIEGDGFHGFSIALAQRWLENARQITARIANQGPWLDGTLSLSPETRDALPHTSHLPLTQVWQSPGLRLSGWVIDPNQPERHVHLVVREQDRILARAVANRPYPALQHRPSHDHGFDIQLPWELADGTLHELHLESDLGTSLTRAPLRICEHPTGLEGLLRQHWPTSSKHAPARELILRLAHEQDLRAPRTLGFALYPQWYACHQATLHGAPQKRQRPPRIGVMLLADSQDPALQRSQQSLQQPDIRLEGGVVRAPLNQAPEAARMLLERGAQMILPLQAGDRIAKHGLARLLYAWHTASKTQEPAWLFGDCDQDGPDGERTHPWFKPCWDPDLFMGADLFTPGAIFSAEIINSALQTLKDHWDIPEPPDWQALLAAIALNTTHTQARVIHVPQVVYHRSSQRPHCPSRYPADPRRERAIHWMARQMNPNATVSQVPGFPALHRTHWPLPPNPPRVSLIIPTRDRVDLLRPCLEGLLGRTDYPNLEILVVDNESTCPATLAYLEELTQHGVRVLKYPHPFNYSAINNHAVTQATGTLIGLLNNDVVVQHPDWLGQMVAHLQRPGVGAVGAKLLWPNGMVQHGGVVLGINGLAAHTGNFWHEDDPGYLGINQLTRRQTAVTAACLLLPRAVYQNVGGLDEKAFPVAFNDVDLCLKIRQSGHEILWTPAARLIHAESASRGKDEQAQQAARARREQQHLRERWPKQTEADRYYHPCLNHDWASGPYQGLHAINQLPLIRE